MKRFGKFVLVWATLAVVLAVPQAGRAQPDCAAGFTACQSPDRGSNAPAVLLNMIGPATVHTEAAIWTGLGCAGDPATMALEDLPLSAGPQVVFLEFRPDPIPNGTQISVKWKFGDCAQTACYDYTIGSDPPPCDLVGATPNAVSASLPKNLFLSVSGTIVASLHYAISLR